MSGLLLVPDSRTHTKPLSNPSRIARISAAFRDIACVSWQASDCIDPLMCACCVHPQEAAATAAKRPVPVLDTGRGPFASTLGVLNPPDEEIEEEQLLAQEKPLFQQRMDWHFAAHFTDDESQNALQIEEDARQRTLEAAAPRVDEELKYEEPTYQYMTLDDREAAALKSGSAKGKMPTSWQEFQAMRDELTRLTETGSKKQREKATELSEHLETFYDVFKARAPGPSEPHPGPCRSPCQCRAIWPPTPRSSPPLPLFEFFRVVRRASWPRDGAWTTTLSSTRSAHSSQRQPSRQRAI